MCLMMLKTKDCRIYDSPRKIIITAELQELLNLRHKRIDILEFPINTGKSHICDRIQILETRHHELTDLRTGNLTHTAVIDFSLDSVDQFSDLFRRYRAFMACPNNRTTPSSILFLLNGSLFISFLTTIRGIISTFSYEVKRFPHESHIRLLRIAVLSSTGLESTTLVLSFPQYGHLIYLFLFFKNSGI